MHRLLEEAYEEASLSERSRCELYQKFQNSEFHVKDKERCGWKQNLHIPLRVNQQAIPHRLKSLEIIQNQVNWVPCELRPRNVEN
ncbi:hypothetical protein TNCV_4588491 [Trichonephila clavipes]|nr:hypothetical protein TNCV_4588491 [Trichonephila clavipes]